MDQHIPVALFAYSRTDLLQRSVEALRLNGVPLLYVFCDGPKDQAQAAAVSSVRNFVHRMDWCEKHVIERHQNLGLGVSIRSGVDYVLSRHEMVIVIEDDIVCTRGTYDYMVAALRQYSNHPRVMSVGLWTHPKQRPPIPAGEPFFDGRFTYLGWGTWRRAWQGMDVPAMKLLRCCRWRLRNPERYGEDIPSMAHQELQLNVWAVRFCLLHLLRRGLCFHPPHSLTEHIGYDDRATNARSAGTLAMPALAASAPPYPAQWPVPREHPASPRLCRALFGQPDTLRQKIFWLARAIWRKSVRLLGRLIDRAS